MKAGCCLDKVKSRWTPESLKAQWKSLRATRAGVRMALNCHSIKENASKWHLHWTSAIEKL